MSEIILILIALSQRITESLRFAQPIKRHHRHVTNPAMQDPAYIQLVPPAKLEIPSLEVALTLARREVLLATNGLTRLRSLRREADLILGLTAVLAGHSSNPS
jgi:hypothetical protein